MSTATTYPEPDQLRSFANEPMPFHTIDPSLVDANDDAEHSDENGGESDGAAVLRSTHGRVTYEYKPAYINVETARDEWHRASDIEWVDVTHREAFEKADHVECSEDYIIAKFVHPDPTQPYMIEAYWLLNSITINCNQ